MKQKWQNMRRSTHIEDRRWKPDIYEPVPRGFSDPTSVDPGKARLDLFRAQTAVRPLEQYDFKSAMRRKRQ